MGRKRDWPYGSVRIPAKTTRYASCRPCPTKTSSTRVSYPLRHDHRPRLHWTLLQAADQDPEPFISGRNVERPRPLLAEMAATTPWPGHQGKRPVSAEKPRRAARMSYPFTPQAPDSAPLLSMTPFYRQRIWNSLPPVISSHPLAVTTTGFSSIGLVPHFYG